MEKLKNSCGKYKGFIENFLKLCEKYEYNFKEFDELITKYNT